jgi:hypothetical protein
MENPRAPIKNSFKKDDVCDFGQLDVKTRIAVSQTGNRERGAILLPAHPRRVGYLIARYRAWLSSRSHPDVRKALRGLGGIRKRCVTLLKR